MSGAAWRQRFLWTLPENPWEVQLERKWRWQFQDDRGSGWGRWYVAPAAGGEFFLADPDLAPAYSTGIVQGTDFAIVGSATSWGFRIQRLELGRSARTFFGDKERLDVGTLSSDETLVSIVRAQHGDWQHPMLHVLMCGNGKSLAQLADGPASGLRAGPWSPVAGDQRLIILHERRGWWRPAIWMPGMKQLIDLSIDLLGDVEAQWYPDASGLLLIHEWQGRGELYRFDLASQQMVKIESEPGSIWAAGFRSDGLVWYRWSNAMRPSEIRIESGEKLPRELVPQGAAFQDLDIDGIHAFLVEPQSMRPHPTIFRVYGHPVFHFRDHFMPDVQTWVEHGFAFVVLNCRGSNGYGKAWRDASLGNVGWTEMEDIAKIYDRVVAAGIADPTRMILNGASWGGYLTLFGMGTQPERWSLGLAEFPVGDFVACYPDASDPIKATMRVQMGGTPEEVPEAYQKASPLTYIDQVCAPVMLLVGEHDHLCPIRQNDNYIARLRDLGKIHEVYRFNGGHGSYDGVEQIRHMEAELAFLMQHFGIIEAK